MNKKGRVLFLTIPKKENKILLYGPKNEPLIIESPRSVGFRMEKNERA